MSIDNYKLRFEKLRVRRANGCNSPHKICMILALLEMARSGHLKQNRILYDVELLDRYREYFDAVKANNDHHNPYFPFFHLKSDGFWHLHPVTGRAQILDSMTTARSHNAIRENISYVTIDDELFDLLQNRNNIDELACVLAKKWFNRGLEELTSIAEQAKKISNYEYGLREGDSAIFLVQEPLPESVRSPAFRRVVTEIYDYRCAATGLRILFPDGSAMVEAAHIHPFCEAKDDDPRNGLALLPHMHWAMDRGWITPTTEYRWKVSSQIDERIPDFNLLTNLNGQKLILPRETKWYPKREVLEWRMQNLKRD